MLFLYQGLLALGRGTHLLIEAFSELPLDRHLVFMGYGELAEDVKCAAQAYIFCLPFHRIWSACFGHRFFAVLGIFLASADLFTLIFSHGGLLGDIYVLVAQKIREKNSCLKMTILSALAACPDFFYDEAY